MVYIIPRLLNGISFIFVVQSFWPIPLNAYLPLAAIYILASAIGVMIIFIPSGIGVREAVIVLLATQLMPLQTAIIVAAVTRLFTLLGDGLLAICYIFLKITSTQKKIIRT